MYRSGKGGGCEGELRPAREIDHIYSVNTETWSKKPVKLEVFIISVCKFELRETSSSLPPPPRHTIGQNYRDREIVAQPSKGSNPGLGRTPVKSTIWSHDGQKDPFLIFGCLAPKIGKKSWRETFGTISVKVQSPSRLKFRKFDPRSHHKRTEPRFWSRVDQKHHLVACRSKRPIRNFRPWSGQNW